MGGTYSDDVQARIELVAVGLQSVFQVVIQTVEVVNEHLLRRRHNSHGEKARAAPSSARRRRRRHLQRAAAAQLIDLVMNLVEYKVLVVLQSKPPSGINDKRL